LSRRVWPAVALGLALALPSLGTVEKYLGTAVAVVYLAAMLVVAPVAERFALPLFLRLVGERGARWLAVATYVGLVVAFVVVYPIADSEMMGSGSDRDDASNLATNRLLDGEYPYAEKTYLGNPVSQLPGALVLAAPFVVLGTSAWQNFLWIPVFFVALARHLGSARLALFASWIVLAVSPGVLRELLTGGDLIANGIYVAVPMLVLLRVPPGRWLGLAVAVFLGVALSSRANYVYALPLLFAALAQLQGWREAILRTGIVSAALVAITLPFYAYDPDGFTPLKTSGKLSQFDEVAPHLDLAVVAVAVVLTLGLALRRFDRRGFALMSSAAIVQMFLLIAVVVLDSIRLERLDFSFLIPGYGLVALVFALFGAWGPWARTESAERHAIRPVVSDGLAGEARMP
jgi:hypothetical protein